MMKNYSPLEGTSDAARCWYLTVFCTAVLTVVSGCIASFTVDESDLEQVEKPPGYSSPTFEFEPSPNQSEVNLSIGIVKSQYSYDKQIEEGLILDDEIGGRLNRYSSNIDSSIERGIQDIIESNGFSYAGSFSSLENMTFPEKDNTDMVVSMNIEVDFESKIDTSRGIYWISTIGGEPAEKPLKVSYNDFEPVAPKYEEVGTFISQSKVYVRILEPLTGEKLLVEEISVDEVSEEFTWYYWFTTKVDEGEIKKTGKYAVEGYDGREQALSSLVSGTYTSVLDRIDEFMGQDRLVKMEEDIDKLKERWNSSNQ